MPPSAPTSVPSRRLALVGLLVAPAWSLAGCASDDSGPRDATATDPTGTPSATASPSSSPASTTPSSAAGGYPAYPGQDYDYTLTVACFCAGGGTPILVSVRSGAITGATFQGDGRGAATGDDAGGLALTIQAIIDRANAGPPDRVEVVQPAGQDWPTSVTIAGAPGVADDGIGWYLSGVTPV